MNNLNSKVHTDTDTKKQAVDKLVEHYRSTNKTITKEGIFEIYNCILDDIEVAGLPFYLNDSTGTS
jgi:hypothetical protein